MSALATVEDYFRIADDRGRTGRRGIQNRFRYSSVLSRSWNNYISCLIVSENVLIVHYFGRQAHNRFLWHLSGKPTARPCVNAHRPRVTWQVRTHRDGLAFPTGQLYQIVLVPRLSEPGMRLPIATTALA